MCGIVGYCGNKQAEGILLDGLHKLEYRGYDSVGIACRDLPNRNQGITQDEVFNISKEVGKVSDLERLCKENPIHGSFGIGHCRWATHGSVSWKNAHPHLSSDGSVVLVHNGIIENYVELREILQDKGYSFSSEGDSEAVANLLAYMISDAYDEGLAGSDDLSIHARAVLSLKRWLKGAYALAIMFKDSPHDIFAIRKESPLAVGIGEEELYVASDIIPLAVHSSKVLYLKNHQLAHLSYEEDSARLQYFLEDGTLAEIDKYVQALDLNVETIDKQGYAHFMQKEIYEQPNIFANMYSTYIDQDYQVSKFRFSKSQQNILQTCKRIIFVSCGTSYHSSLYASYLFECYINIPCSVEYASEFRYRSPVLDSNTLIVALSQSGETADTLAALHLGEGEGAKTLGMVNVDTSSIARMVDIMLCTDCGPEIGVASTKAYTAQMLLLYYLMLYVGNLRGFLTKEDIKNMVEPSRTLPQLSEKILSQDDTMRDLGRAYAGYQHMLYLGRGLLYPLALEGALKMKELSYIHAEGYAAAEMKHGPIALIDSSMPIVVCSPKHDLLYEKMQSNIAEVKARGGRVFALVSEGDQNLDNYDDVCMIPALSEHLDPILFSIPLQMFAYHAALARGYDPDQPRNLAKSVTVE